MQAALIVLDGWGLADHDHLDAIRAAETPTFDRLRRAGAFGTLTAWGRSVGLPEGGMGNSEVGHLTIGAGRVVDQARTRIDAAIEDGTFFENPALVSAFDHAAEDATEDEGDANENDHGRVHLAGLVSDAGVHSDQAHLHALVEMAADRDVEAVTQAFTDGRDTAPSVADEYLAELEDVVEEHRTGDVATVSGRYYAMDRDENWDRTRLVYDAIVRGVADHRAATAVEAVEAAHDRGETDEFIHPTRIQAGPPLSEGDSVVAFNFRADRMRQLVRMLAGIDPAWPDAADPPDVRLVTMTSYDETFDLPVAFPAAEPEDTLGAVLADYGLSQLRIAETEKYAHVTYFMNGGREVEFEGERREIVPSPDVPTYDLTPEMSAPAVTDRAIAIIGAEDPDVLVLNYANPDMVGHTGDFEAAVTAVEAVDAQLARLLAVLQARGANVFVVADHGNADDMGTLEAPHTAHTFNPVPFVYLAPDGTNGGWRVRAGGGLSDVAPTILAVLDVDRPTVMSGESLLE